MEIKDRILEGFDELNKLSLIGEKAETVRKRFAEVLEEAYIAGIAAAAYILGEDPKVDIPKMAESLVKSYDGVSIYMKAVEYANERNEEELKRLLESEWHRVFTQGELDMAEAAQGEILKRWVTMDDLKVRATHRYLEGIAVPLDAEYVTYDGDRAKAPGGFSKAENNANCRCYLTFERI